ncbi:MAG: hypothetical protein U9R48_03530 [Chloroflexota bacterium]|nr:hypothetical protein [Chloroflexota bacterium]
MTVNVPGVTDYVMGHTFFGALEEAQVRDLARMGSLQKMDAGQILGLGGDCYTAVYLVMEGRILRRV